MRRTRSGAVGGVACGICLCSGNGKYRTWIYRGCRISVFSGCYFCSPLRGRNCRLTRLTTGHLCHMPCRVTRIFAGLFAEGHQLVSRWAAHLADMVLQVTLYDHIRHRDYQKLWISPIIKSITLSKAILTMNMYIIAHQFIFKIICLDNIKLLTQFMC